MLIFLYSHVLYMYLQYQGWTTVIHFNISACQYPNGTSFLNDFFPTAKDDVVLNGSMLAGFSVFFIITTILTYSLRGVRILHWYLIHILCWENRGFLHLYINSDIVPGTNKLERDSKLVSTI